MYSVIYSIYMIVYIMQLLCTYIIYNIKLKSNNICAYEMIQQILFLHRYDGITCILLSDRYRFVSPGRSGYFSISYNTPLHIATQYIRMHRYISKRYRTMYNMFIRRPLLSNRFVRIYYK